MLKKTANQSLKNQTDKLKERLDSMVGSTEELIKATGMPAQGQPNPPDSILDNLLPECEDHKFWLNFKKAAPMLFCSLMEHDQ